MQPRVTAILVADEGNESLERTLAGLAAQTRPPEALVIAEAGTTDDSVAQLAGRQATHVVRTRRVAFGQAVNAALRSLPEPEGENEWLWLLTQDNAPHPRALAALVGAVEVAPSVAVAGPKLMRGDDESMIAEFGTTMTGFGAAVPLVEDELDQAQHDEESDVLAVAAPGMLVRRSIFAALAGFDPALPNIDAALDFCVRARLTGHRVIRVPGAKVTGSGGLERFERSRGCGSTALKARIAQLHRRLVYAMPWALPLHWLSLLPLAVLRSLWHLLAKRPGAVPAELTAAVVVAFRGGVGAARRNLRRTKKVGWSAIAPLRMRPGELRERRAGERAARRAIAEPDRKRAPKFFGGGIWLVVLAALVGAVSFGALIGAPALMGGGLVPLSEDIGEIWAALGYGWRETGLGFIGAADPFHYVLAVLGSLTFWSPSTAVVALYIAALPLAALAGWWCAARFTDRAWAAVAGGALWAVAPPFLDALNDGRLGAVIAHLLLPWLVLAAVNAARSWAAAATAALLFAATSASAPVLVPALLVAWLAWCLARPGALHRLAWMPLPALTLFAPLVVQQLGRGRPLALLADPGVPLASDPAPAWQLALGFAEQGLPSWSAVLPGEFSTAAVLALVAPLVVLAMLAPFLRASALGVFMFALLGMVTAAVAGHALVAFTGGTSIPVWAGSGLSLYWLGLVLAAVIAVSAIRRSTVLSIVATGAGVLLALPLLAAGPAATRLVAASPGRMLPAFVHAEAQADPHVGTLVLGAGPDGAITAGVHHGQGTTLDERSTLAATDPEVTEGERRLAALAANLVGASGYDASNALADSGISFVLLDLEAPEERANLLQAMSNRLDLQPALAPVGQTTTGLLWRAHDPATASGADETASATSGTILAVQGVAFALTLLLAVPTRRPIRSRKTEDSEPIDEEPDE